MALHTRAHPALPALRVLVLLIVAIASAAGAYAETGYDVWLRYVPVDNAALRESYRKTFSSIVASGQSPTLIIATKELQRAGLGLLGASPRIANAIDADGAVVIGTPATSPAIAALGWKAPLAHAGHEGYVIRSTTIGKHAVTVIASQGEVGALYGAFHFLRLMQTHQPIGALNLSQRPRLNRRMLDHWDNLDGTIERGYAGKSLWNWSELPDRVDPRVEDYARLNASIGINGSVINSVNANPLSLTHTYLEKAAALARAMRPYGIRVYLSANFAAPKILDKLPTTDPLDPAVATWWREKADEIYRLIPDFGGFVVKANSEGQPGPQDYHRTHADGANVLADALAPHGGIVMWRAFVYNPDVDPDRVKRAYAEFVPLDGKFRANVFAQVKNGPLDFQPREPFHPLFGALPHTPIMTELQITQEYLGQSTHLVYLGTMWTEFLNADTYAAGAGSPVSKVIDGTLQHYADTGIAGVANTGTDQNWTGHHFGQANWYAFGRLAWNPDLSAEAIANEWIAMTWTHAPAAAATIRSIMLDSREAYVNYTMPLGLHHLIGGNHYAPMPENGRAPRADWTAVYFHHADANGIGFDRTKAGSDGVDQYRPPLNAQWSKPATTPDALLLWFHHLPWDYTMKSGRTLWDEIVRHYTTGVAQARSLETRWATLDGQVDAERYQAVLAKLHQQVADAEAWREKCLRYFQQFSKREIAAAAASGNGSAR
jgi:alpha-glucuronidase